MANETLSSIQERNIKHPNGGPEASRISAAARRKLANLMTSLDQLADMLESPECISEHEKNRRRDLVTALRNRREQMQMSLKRDHGQQNRAALMQQAGQSSGPAQETDRTAELDNLGILDMQQDVIQEQDLSLAQMEQSVASTRHLALTINEELHVQERLLEDFEEEVDVSHNKMRAAQKRIKSVLKGSSGDWRSMLLAAGLVILLVFILLLAFKVIL
ncbi:MAG: Qc-snare Syn8 Syntaxin8-family, partial [Trebouxia sp. A1-2]